MILGEIPNGAPGPDTAPPLRAPIPPDQTRDVLRLAREVILTATGPRGGERSTIDVRAFDKAIRVFMPLGHYAAAPSQPISVMDYKMYACRLVHRLLNTITGRRLIVGGAYNSHLATNAKASALYDALVDVVTELDAGTLVPSGAPEKRKDVPPPSRRPDPQPSQASIEQQMRHKMLEEVERRVREEVARRLEAESLRRVRAEEKPFPPPPPQLQQETRPDPAYLWAECLTDAGARHVFLHLAHHGSASEAEIIHFLGSPRAFRRFSADFDDHALLVPFRVRIETGLDGKRYVKDGEK